MSFFSKILHSSYYLKIIKKTVKTFLNEKYLLDIYL